MPLSPPKDDHLLLKFLLLKFDEMTQIVAAMDDELAVRSPALPGANSPYGIFNHCLGMMRRWSSSVNRGIQIPRDRSAEFTQSGPVQEILDRAAAVREEFISDVLAVDLSSAPACVPEGRGTFWTTTTQGVLMHVFEELSQHLGQLEITRDILKSNT